MNDLRVNFIALRLNKHGRLLHSEEHADFLVHTYTDIALDRPWTYYEYLERRSVGCDAGKSWLRIAPGVDFDYSVSLRLHNAAEERVLQKDALLIDNHSELSSHWKEGVPVVNLFLLKRPADLPTGKYELRLVICDSETGKPAAELDVWNTEIALARLKVTEIE
ncbi:MAG: hypothetical protein OXF76_03925 [Caldilineaceae bacterium]|nr:hypothetical protein [Caldilineaceae bacterium]